MKKTTSLVFLSFCSCILMSYSVFAQTNNVTDAIFPSEGEKEYAEKMIRGQYEAGNWIQFDEGWKFLKENGSYLSD